MQYIIVALGSVVLTMIGLKGCEEYFKTKGYESSQLAKSSDNVSKTIIVAGIVGASTIASIIITKKLLS